MIAEIKAAVRHIEEHLCSGAPRPAASRMAKSLSTTLPERCSPSWDVDEPERGSASRAVHWQRHAGGEGLDAILVDACRDAGARDDDEATQWLPHPFTLWIDPGCVAIRLGPGPGASRSGFTFADGGVALSSWSAATFRQGSINVIFGHLPLEAPSMPSLPTVALLPSTPNLSDIKASMAQRQRSIPRAPSALAIGTGVSAHQRTISDASTSSFCSSTFSAVTRGGSDVSRCTSLSSSSDGLMIRNAGSECCGREEEQEEHEDLADETAHINIDEDDARLAGFFGTFDLVDDDCEDERDGDATIAAIERTPSRPKASIDAASTQTPTARPPSFVPSHKKQSASGSELNFTVHDRGNVGVLGGGVKLGGASPAKKDRTPLPRSGGAPSPTRLPRAQAPVWMPSGGEGSRSSFPSLPAPPSLQQRPSEQGSTSIAATAAAAWGDAPPFVPSSTQQQQQQHPRHFSQPQPQHFFPAPSTVTGRCNSSIAPPPPGLGAQRGYAFPSPAPAPLKGLFGGSQDVFNGGMLPSLQHEHGYSLPYGGPAPHHGYHGMDGTGYGGPHPHGLHLGMTVPMPLSHLNHQQQMQYQLQQGGKRIRSRGRRSRGRGAGRAARRHAAALRALAEKQGKTLEEFLAEQEACDERLRASASASSSSASYAAAARRFGQQQTIEEGEEEDDDDDDEGSDDEGHHVVDSRRASIVTLSSASSSSTSSDDACPASPPTPCVLPSPNADANGNDKPAPRSDEDIMRLVRQRADELSRNLERRRIADVALRRNQGIAHTFGMAGAAWGHLRPAPATTTNGRH